MLGALTQSVDGVQNMKFSCLQCEVVTDCTKRFSLLLTQSVEVTLRAVPGAVLCQKFPKGDSALAYLCLQRGSSTVTACLTGGLGLILVLELSTG